jgi:hypothetical protein
MLHPQVKSLLRYAQELVPVSGHKEIGISCHLDPTEYEKYRKNACDGRRRQQ